MRQAQFLTVVDRDEADRRFREALAPLAPLGEETVPLLKALGRVLARDVSSPVDVPGFDRSNVDGFAVVAADTFGAMEQSPQILQLLPESVMMGVVPSLPVRLGQAMAIPTGGVIPRGADAVVMVENTVVNGEQVLVHKPVTPGRSVTFAGTDVAMGEVVLRAGRLLTSRETGILAAIGVSDVPVFQKPRVAILSTGDELIPPGEEAALGKIFDSNAIMVAHAVQENGGQPLIIGIVSDTEEAIEAGLLKALETADMVILSGGTSKGPGDLNIRVLEKVLSPPGILAHGVALKPGKPLCLAASGKKGVVVLPGFPTSAIFTFHELVAPVLRRLAGLPETHVPQTQAKLPFRVSSENGRTEYVLTRLVENAQGERVAYPIGKGSGSVTTWSLADGYFVVPKLVEQLDAGEWVDVLPLGGEKATAADLVIIGSHCVGLDIVIDRLRARGVTCKMIAVGSQGGLEAVMRGECDAATMHLYDPSTQTYNQPFLTPSLSLIPGYRRLQGVVFRKGDPRFEGKTAEEAVASAGRLPGVVMINRNRGSGTRAIIDRMLGDARPDGYGVEASSHHATAAAVSQGRADFGVAIDVVAIDRNLGFLPIAEEHYDFVIPKSRAARPAVRILVEELSHPSTWQALRARGFRR
ncbi:MAG: molybdopterin biosynthesis protein [Polyangiaceae bacterium]|nr:molybdopterin biosynthesis protein [Polyangiaceae bacterium]